MISIKSQEEIAVMEEGGKILAQIVKELVKKIRPGVSTRELERVAEALVLKSGGQCSFKGYEDYPACLCVSVNQEIVHAVPSERILKEGDIVSLDLGLLYRGYHTDMAVTLALGKISPKVKKLVDVTREALRIGIRQVRPGNTFGDISDAIQRYVEGQGFNVIRDLCGHGIGQQLHEDPQILNYGQKGSGEEIKEGMTFCIEPMVAVGEGKIKKSKDGHAYETADGSLSAHFEHTVLATKNGVKVLT